MEINSKGRYIHTEYDWLRIQDKLDTDCNWQESHFLQLSMWRVKSTEPVGQESVMKEMWRWTKSDGYWWSIHCLQITLHWYKHLGWWIPWTHTGESHFNSHPRLLKLPGGSNMWQKQLGALVHYVLKFSTQNFPICVAYSIQWAEHH
jgi:hypothetical protein